MSDAREQAAQHSTVEFAELLWTVAYRLDCGYSPNVQYEAAVERLLSEMEVMGDISADETRRAKHAAQERLFGEARGKDSHPLSEFGVTTVSSDQ